MTRIIGLGHRKRVGKDTFARLLTTHLTKRGRSVQILPFARPLKEVCHLLFGCAGMGNEWYYESPEADKDVEIPAIGKSARQVMIEVGQKMREVDPQVWVRLAMNQAEHSFSDYVIIPDVRHRNEVQAIHVYNGLLLKVVRPDAPVGKDEVDGMLDDFTGWDSVIHNDGSLQDLDTTAAMWAEQLVKQGAAA